MSRVWPKIRAIGRIAAIATLAPPVLGVQMAVAGPVFKDYDTLPRFIKRRILKTLGISVSFNKAAAARMDNSRPILYAANHMSYLDIVTLGAFIPGAFVAKSDVKKWPLIGLGAKCVGTIFTERRVGTLRRDQGQIVEKLNGGRDVILFPEGTTTCGDELLPFKNGLLCVAFNNVSRVKLAQDIHVQPISLRVTHVNGAEAKLGMDERRIYAWYGGKNIASHFWELAQLDSMKMEITAHPPLNPSDFPDRRTFAHAVQNKVRCAA